MVTEGPPVPAPMAWDPSGPTASALSPVRPPSTASALSTWTSALLGVRPMPVLMSLPIEVPASAKRAVSAPLSCVVMSTFITDLSGDAGANLGGGRRRPRENP
jgi:hypothetical protein